MDETMSGNRRELNLNLNDRQNQIQEEKIIPAETPENIVAAETIKEEKNMTRTLKVEGMMCMHCEARVKKALEAIPGVESATADHTAGTAVATLNAPVEDETLRAAVESQGYKVHGIE